MVLTFEFVDQIQKCDLIQVKATKQYFSVVLFIMLYKEVLNKVVLNFESVDEILMCDHSNESY